MKKQTRTSEEIEDSLMNELEKGVNIIEKIIDVLVNSEKYRNSQRLLNAIDKLNKISVSW